MIPDIVDDIVLNVIEGSCKYVQDFRPFCSLIDAVMQPETREKVK